LYITQKYVALIGHENNKEYGHVRNLHQGLLSRAFNYFKTA